MDFVLKKYDKIIVLEDDIIVSSNFLYFMNKALNKFKYKTQKNKFNFLKDLDKEYFNF